MSVRITDTVTADGRKFQQMLKELAEKEVRVGFQHGKATEEDGTDICDIAAWNELGTVHIPARPFLRMSVDDNDACLETGRYIPREASRRTFLRQGYAQVLWREALGHESPQ